MGLTSCARQATALLKEATECYKKSRLCQLPITEDVHSVDPAAAAPEDKTQVPPRIWKESVFIEVLEMRES